MNKLLALMLLMSLLSVSCNKSGGGSDSSAQDTTTTTPVVDSNPTSDEGVVDSGEDPEPTPAPVIVPQKPSTLPALALSFMTNVDLMNFTSTQASKYEKAVQMVKLVVGTEEFRTKVLNHTYSGKKQFVDNGGKTNSQIYQSILDAAEKLTPAKNNTLDLEVELYYASNTVVGYTYPTSTQIWVNRKYFDQYAVNQVAGNLFHEWLHKLGYGHASSATASRPYSVPYAIGYMIRDIGKKFL